jgi:hypothetical protein
MTNDMPPWFSQGCELRGAVPPAPQHVPQVPSTIDNAVENTDTDTQQLSY